MVGHGRPTIDGASLEGKQKASTSRNLKLFAFELTNSESSQNITDEDSLYLLFFRAREQSVTPNLIRVANGLIRFTNGFQRIEILVTVPNIHEDLFSCVPIFPPRSHDFL